MRLLKQFPRVIGVLAMFLGLAVALSAIQTASTAGSPAIWSAAYSRQVSPLPTNTPTPTRLPPTATNTPTPTAAPAGSSRARSSRARLNISSVSCVGCLVGSGNNIEVHFVVVNDYRRVNDYGSVSYTIRLPDGSTATRAADFSKHTGNAVHYADRFSGGNGAYTLVSASVTVDGVRYDLSNPGSVYETDCRPCNTRPR